MNVATELESPQTGSAIQVATDAIVRITTSTICGTDLHILKGDLLALPRRRLDPGQHH
jgi:threonine dehydrogenase-like Zn-dependent dehydrogenase